LLLGALALAVGFALLPAVTPARGLEAAAAARPYLMSPAARTLSTVAILAVWAFYCGWLWSGGRRTLPMKTWRLVLQTAGGGSPGLARALARFLACWAGPTLAIGGFVAAEPTAHGGWAAALLAFNYVWGAFDPDRQFLQDRIAGTRLLLEARPPS